MRPVPDIPKIDAWRLNHWHCSQWLLLLTLVSLAGCSGCRPDSDQLTREELEKRAKEQRDSLQMSELLTLPTDSELKILTAKPGHWYETQQQFKSNREDLQVVAVGSIARGTELANIPGTDVINEFTRRTSLPKGQTKTVDLQYFVPYSGKKEDPNAALGAPSSRLNFRTELLSWPLLTPILQSPNVKPANELKEHEYQLAVLSPQALSYEYLTYLDAVYWRGDELMQEERIRSYHVALCKPVDNKYAFPHSMLTMTATAVLVWDDVSVDDLSVEQQNAIVDWVHWGGQLLVSGPSSWSRLQNSFLSPYLPADTADAAEFGSEAFVELSNTFVVPDRTAPDAFDPMTIVGPPIGGLRFKLNEQGAWLPGAGELVAESQVGRGRIVVTGFPLSEPRIYRWKYFSSFFSTGLLRRPPRTIELNQADRMLYHVWADPFEGSERDARLHSSFRILTRDLPLSTKAASALEGEAGAATATEVASRTTSELNTPTREDPNAIEASRWGTGGAAWNDYSGLSFQALATLKAAAGIELPSRKTILYLLAGYLVCLVPLNWLVFRIIGRLEFAWLAAPIMAIIGVVVVTKVARLDIGFARRTTEVSLLELQGDHARAHLTQYIALYSSLSTNYSVEFPENGSVALPLGDISRARRRAAAETRNLRTNYGRTDGVTLEPFTVYSNSTEMVHAEQIVGLEGGLLLGQSSAELPALKNETGLEIRGAMVLKCLEAGRLQYAWIGDLANGQAVNLNYEPASIARLWENWELDPATQANVPPEQSEGSDAVDSLWIGGLLSEIVRKTPLMPGQTRLFAYTDDRPGDLKVLPKEDQFDGRCVIVAHLTPQTLGQVVPDELIMSRPITGQGEALDANGVQEDDDVKPTDLVPVN
jgi:hypothetical protein